MSKLTLDDVADWTMRETAHYNGGKEWFGYGHQCLQQPRLHRMDRYTRQDRSVQSTWSVDGVDCADLAEAIDRLNVDPVVTADELAILAAVVPGHIKETRNTEVYHALPDASSILHHWLGRKGLIWAENGHVTRTELGERMLKQVTAAR